MYFFLMRLFVHTPHHRPPLSLARRPLSWYVSLFPVRPAASWCSPAPPTVRRRPRSQARASSTASRGRLARVSSTSRHRPARARVCGHTTSWCSSTSRLTPSPSARPRCGGCCLGSRRRAVVAVAWSWLQRCVCALPACRCSAWRFVVVGCVLRLRLCAVHVAVQAGYVEEKEQTKKKKIYGDKKPAALVARRR